MKYIFLKNILLICFVIIQGQNIYAQKDGKTDSRSSECLNDIYTIKKDFLFKVNGELYKDGKTLSLCPNAGNTIINLVHAAEPNNPVSEENQYEIVWQDDPNLTENWQVTLLADDIENNTTRKLKVSINGSSDYKLKIKNTVKIEFKQDSNSPYDDGYYKYTLPNSSGVNVTYTGQYPAYGINPTTGDHYFWKFIAQNSIESLELKANKKKAHDLKTIHLEADNLDLLIDPNENFESNETIIQLTNNDNVDGGRPISINGCGVNDEVKIWSSSRSDIVLNFFLLGEEQAGGAINYPAVVPEADLMNITAELNTFYNKYNVYFESNYILTNISLDYDPTDSAVPTIPGDVITDDLENIEELIPFHNPMEGELPVIYCHDLGGNTLGIGVTPGGALLNAKYLLVIDRIDGMASHVHAHEIGHTCFNLVHLDEVINQNDIRNLMYSIAENGNNLNDYNLRRTQYNRIHQNYANQQN